MTRNEMDNIIYQYSRNACSWRIVENIASIFTRCNDFTWCATQHTAWRSTEKLTDISDYRETITDGEDRIRILRAMQEIETSML